MTFESQSENKDERLLRLASKAAEEVDAVLALLPLAVEVQWDRAAAGRGERDETGRRASGGHADPTADTATDPGRLYVRTVLTRCDPILDEAVIALRGVRRGLERALTWWEGEERQPTDAAPSPAAPPA